MATTSWDVLGVSVVQQPQWDVLTVTVDGHLFVTPTWDVIDISMVGRQVAQIVNADTEPAEPFTTVTLTASSVGPSNFDSCTWRVAAGSLALSAAGFTCTFPAPATENGVTVTVAATLSRGAVQSKEAQVDVVILPHLIWDAEGTTWQPSQFSGL